MSKVNAIILNKKSAKPEMGESPQSAVAAASPRFDAILKWVGASAASGKKAKAAAAAKTGPSESGSKNKLRLTFAKVRKAAVGLAVPLRSLRMNPAARTGKPGRTVEAAKERSIEGRVIKGRLASPGVWEQAQKVKERSALVLAGAGRELGGARLKHVKPNTVNRRAISQSFVEKRSIGLNARDQAVRADGGPILRDEDGNARVMNPADSQKSAQNYLKDEASREEIIRLAKKAAVQTARNNDSPKSVRETFVRQSETLRTEAPAKRALWIKRELSFARELVTPKNGREAAETTARTVASENAEERRNDHARPARSGPENNRMNADRVQSKPEAVQAKPEVGQAKSEAVQAKSEAGQAKSETVQAKPGGGAGEAKAVRSGTKKALDPKPGLAQETAERAKPATRGGTTDGLEANGSAGLKPAKTTRGLQRGHVTAPGSAQGGETPVPAASVEAAPLAVALKAGSRSRAVSHLAALLSAKVEFILANARPEVRLELHPPRLGEIHIRLIAHGGQTEVSMRAERESVGRILEQAAPLLVQQLEKAGVQVNQVNVDYGELDPQSNRHSRNQMDDADGSPPERADAENLDDPKKETASGRISPTHDGEIDVLA